MPQSYSFDAARPRSGFTLSTAAGGSLRDQGPAWKLDGETLAKLDAIRDQLGVASRGQALDSVVTSFWRERRAFHTVASDGDREAEILGRIYALAQAEACSPGQAVESAIAAFTGREARAREGEVEAASLEDAKGRLVEESKVSANLRMAGA